MNMSFSIPGQLIQGTATIDALPSSVPPSPNSQFGRYPTRIGSLSEVVSSGTGVFVAGGTLDFAAIQNLPRSCSLLQASGHLDGGGRWYTPLDRG